MVAYFRSTGDMVWRRYNRNKRSAAATDTDADADDDDVDDGEADDGEGILSRLTRNTDARWRMTVAIYLLDRYH